MANTGNMPIFAVGSFDKIQPAINAGTLSYPSYVYISDQEKLGFVAKDGELHKIVGENAPSVEVVESFPVSEDAKQDVLYVVENTIYKFDGKDYVPLSKDHTSEIADINDKIDKINSELTYDPEAEIPEEGEPGKLYVTEKGIEVWDSTSQEYKVIASNPSEDDTLHFIDLDALD